MTKKALIAAKKQTAQPRPATVNPPPASRSAAPVPPTADQLAEIASRPSVNAAAVMSKFGREPFEKLGEVDLWATARHLESNVAAVHGGDMRRVEAMLVSQAHALQSMFMHMSRRALNQDYQSHLESFFRMAMKAQNQCRMTLETLATIKHGPTVFAKQANINNGGQQQVNNGVAARAAGAPATKSETEQNELLEAPHGQGLDTGAQSPTGRVDSHMEALGEIHRAAQR